MILNIKNLGALKEAEIDLSKDLILLCGHNNTGKTYVAYAIYVLLYNDISGFHAKADDFIINSISDINIDLITFYKKRKKDIEYSLQQIKQLSTKKIFQNSDNFNNVTYNFALPNIEAIKLEIQKENYFYVSSTINNGTIHRVTKNKSKLCFDMVGNNEVSNNINNESIEYLVENSDNIQKYINDLIGKSLGFKSWQNIKFFSSERAAINIFSKELAINKGHTLDEILKAKGAERERLLELADKNINRYQKPIADELAIAEDLLNLSKRKSDFEFLAIELEKSILEGKISIGQYGGLQYQPNDSSENIILEITQTSSLVKSLASLVFYLRHLAEKNDCIIIDEPELNLHPDNQILVARFLARLVNEGFKVVASTHSDYIIGELSNLLMLNNQFEDKEKLMERYNYNQNEILDKEKVGVYYFEKGKNNTAPIEITKRGIQIPSVDKAIADLNERSSAIFYTLLETDEEE